MILILSGRNGQDVLSCVDETGVSSETEKEHLQSPEEMLILFYVKDVRLYLSKIFGGP